MIFKKNKSVASLDKNYLNLCKNAASNDDIFQNFRNLKEYKNILEHVDRDLAVKYLENIKNISDLSNKDIFKVCNLLSNVGNPELVQLIEGENPVSTTSLRYLNVALDIKTKFNQNTFNHIVEIGPGYGGQSIILQEFFNIDKYTYIDLPDVNKLIEKFINSHKINFMTEHKTLNDDFDDNNYDLVISNYAFSELDYKLQSFSINNIINKSKYCYMIINSDAFKQNEKYKKFRFMNRNELLNKINNSYIDIEIPLTADDNYLLLKNDII